MRYFCSEPCNLLIKINEYYHNYGFLERRKEVPHLSHQLHDDAMNGGTNKNQSSQLDQVLMPQVPNN